MEYGYHVIGASTDPQEKNDAWAKELGLNYPLISDPGALAVTALGIVRDGGYAQRTTFIIGADGSIEHIFENVQISGHVEAVLAELH